MKFSTLKYYALNCGWLLVPAGFWLRTSHTPGSSSLAVISEASLLVLKETKAEVMQDFAGQRQPLDIAAKPGTVIATED